MKPIEIEFGDDSAPQNKNAPINNIYKDNIYKNKNNAPENNKSEILEYEFENGGILLNCKVEEYSKGFALFADFLRDAKKYYRKTCLHAKFIYFFSYRPMYRELNHEQLCWYLFWRAKVRSGDYIKTGLSYIFLYLFEQINLSDLIGAEKVYANIINIWKNYRAEFPRIDKYIAEWLIDFTLINKLKIDLDDIGEILSHVINSASIPEIYMKDNFFNQPANINLILDNMPVYDYKKSKFYSDKDGKNKDLFDYHIAKILNAVLSSEAFDKILNLEVADGVKVKATRESFMGAVCIYDYKKKITVEYKNLWKNFYIRELITNSVRYAENIIRDYLQIKSKLNITGQNFPPELAEIIKNYKDKYLCIVKPAKVSVKTKGRKKEPEEEYEPIEFAPNLEAAAEIERDSWETTNALLELQNKSTQFIDGTEDGFEAIDTNAPDVTYENLAVGDAASGVPPEIPAPLPDTPEDIFDVLDDLSVGRGIPDAPPEPTDAPPGSTEISQLIASLSPSELSALELLLASNSFDEVSADFMREHGQMLESVIESVNEKSLDIMGDIIIENGQIIEDYLDEIKSCLK